MPEAIVPQTVEVELSPREAPAEPLVSIIILVLSGDEMAQRCLESLDLHVAGKVDYETIVVANGTSLEGIQRLQRRDDLTLIRSNVNRGFAGGCNLAAGHARGRFLVFLNDDAVVTRHWLEYLLETASRTDVGAVGSRIVSPDGTLLEAGQVLWNNGRAHSVGRGLRPGSATHFAVRDVDFTSGCSLLVLREAWDQAGGMDEDYFPAYYEDVDLCFRIRRAGYRVLVDPRSVVEHLESASSSSGFKRFLCLRNAEKLKQKWRTELAQLTDAPAGGDPAPFVRAALHGSGGSRPRLLVIDDRLPDPALGAGYGRMLTTVEQLAADNEVTFLPRSATPSAIASKLATWGVDVEAEAGETHLERFAGWYDAVLISRPPNFQRYAPAVRQFQPTATLIYDAEALWYRRLRLQATYTQNANERELLLAQALEMEGLERRAFAEADLAVCLSTDELEIVREWGCRKAHFVSPIEQAICDSGGGFHSRRDLLFTGAWSAGPTSPNVDALKFFVSEILPRLAELTPSVRLLVTGTAPPEIALELSSSRVIFTGHVKKMSDQYAQARVAIAPVRFGSGVKIKTVEALQHGVPVVATSIGAEGIDFGDSRPVAISDDPATLAIMMSRLLNDPAEWGRRRLDAQRWRHQQHTAPAGSSWSEVMVQALEIQPRPPISRGIRR